MNTDKEAKCLLCGENRYLEKCHIIPRSFDYFLQKSGYYQDNLLLLCPTHHKLFDNGLLNEEEKDKIKERIHIVIKWALKSFFREAKKMELAYKKISGEDRYKAIKKGEIKKSLAKKVSLKWLNGIIKEVEKAVNEADY